MGYAIPAVHLAPIAVAPARPPVYPAPPAHPPVPRIAPAPLPAITTPVKPAKLERQELTGNKDQSSWTVAADRARVVVDLPADAKLYVGGRLSKSTLEQRHMETPELTPGKTYTYELRVELVRDGKPITETKKIAVRAGEVVRANFKDVGATVTARTTSK